MSAMKRRSQSAVQLSKSAEIELKRLTIFCRKLHLSAAKIRKIKRIARIMFEDDGKSAASSRDRFEQIEH